MTELECCEIFADNLRQLMFETGYSQTDLAWDAYLDQSTISKYLKGDRLPTVKALINLCIVLDCNFNDLIPDFDYVN